MIFGGSPEEYSGGPFGTGIVRIANGLIRRDLLGSKASVAFSVASADETIGTVSAITGESLVDDLREAVPELAALVEDHLATYGEILPHVLFGEVTQYVKQAAAGGESSVVERVLAFCERALEAGDDYVENIVAISFVENVGPSDPAEAERSGRAGTVTRSSDSARSASPSSSTSEA